MCVSDEVIGEVLRIMGTQSVPYTAFYTALRPSRVRTSDGPFPEHLLMSHTLDMEKTTAVK